MFISILSSCQYNSEIDIVEEVNKCDPEVSFTNTVKPIIDNDCVQCHNGSQFPDLRVYSTISQNAISIKNEVVARSMPLGGSLTPEEIKAISCWIDNGALNN